MHRLEVVRLGEGAVLPADDLLGHAKRELTHAVIIGRNRDGNLHFASTHGCAETLWLIEKAKAVLLSPDD